MCCRCCCCCWWFQGNYSSEWLLLVAWESLFGFPDSSSPDSSDPTRRRREATMTMAREVSFPLLEPCVPYVIGLTSYLAACFLFITRYNCELVTWRRRRFCWLAVSAAALVASFRIPLCGQYAILVHLWSFYQYGCENWFGGRSNAKRSTADWLGPNVDSCDNSPSTWDWYSAM